MDTQTTLIPLLKEMIRIPSPSGEEGVLVDFLARTCKELGFDEVHIDRYGSLTATMIGTKAGPHLLFDGHIDTVGVENRSVWHHDPYQVEIADGLLYGRGTSDMKGAVCAMLVAVSTYAKQTNHHFGGNISVSATVCEECFEGIAARLVTERCKPDMVIVGEATACKLAIGQRGRAEIVVETYGTSCHSSNPEKGSNAALHMMHLLPYLEKIDIPHDPVLGKGIMVLTDLISHPYPGRSVLPNRCRATFDRRLIPARRFLQSVSFRLGLWKLATRWSKLARRRSGLQDSQTSSPITASVPMQAISVLRQSCLPLASVPHLKNLPIPLTNM
jgi:putative selenium metabolism hydrolase